MVPPEEELDGLTITDAYHKKRNKNPRRKKSERRSSVALEDDGLADQLLLPGSECIEVRSTGLALYDFLVMAMQQLEQFGDELRKPHGEEVVKIVDNMIDKLYQVKNASR